MDIKNMTDEQKAKARSCASLEEMLELAQEEGQELSDEQLEAISGGGVWNDTCNDCREDQYCPNYCNKGPETFR